MCAIDRSFKFDAASRGATRVQKKGNFSTCYAILLFLPGPIYEKYLKTPPSPPKKINSQFQSPSILSVCLFSK